MSLSPYVPLLLAVCWMLPAMALAVSYGLRHHHDEESETEPMELTIEEVRAEVLQVDYDAQGTNWKRPDWSGPGSDARSQVQGSSHEVLIPTPYANATVSVGTKADPETRRCTLSLN